MKRTFACGLLVLMTLLTGCPRNQYILELTPKANVIERRLTFFREDGKDTNGAPIYQDFPGKQLANITSAYPPGSVSSEGKRHLARALFAGQLPKDVGGAGSWTNLMTTLGHAAISTERFRGSDDFATTTAKRLEALDRVTDLMIRWSQRELGKEPNYEVLRRFLDVEFRRDLKNLGLYNWARALTSNFNPKVDEEFFARFAQYLSERGYLTLSQLPELYVIITREDYRGLMRITQRLVAAKMGLPGSGPIPKSLGFLSDPNTALESLNAFLATTDAYKTKLSHWEKVQKSNPEANKPDPSEVIGDLLTIALEWGKGDRDDHLVVKLALPSEPIHTNGKWDPTNRQVVWESDLDDVEAEQRLPMFCFASWGTANESFQKAHFGKVIAEGEDLLRYCLWRASLTVQQAGEWEARLASLKPGKSIVGELDAFRFTEEPAATSASDEGQDHLLSAFPRNLFKTALTQ